jgi:hypothetical protein
LWGFEKIGTRFWQFGETDLGDGLIHHAISANIKGEISE